MISAFGVEHAISKARGLSSKPPRWAVKSKSQSAPDPGHKSDPFQLLRMVESKNQLSRTVERKSKRGLGGKA